LAVVVPHYIEAAVCLGSALLGIKAAAEEKLNLWGILCSSRVNSRRDDTTE